MPDLDLVERTLGPRWRKVYKLWKGHHPVPVVADTLIKALAEQLREERGMPGFDQAMGAINLRRRSAGLDERSFADALRALERSFGFSAGAKGMGDCTRLMKVRIDLGLALPSLTALAEQRCREVLDRCFFGKMQISVGSVKTLPDFTALDEFRENILQEAGPGLVALSSRLAADPDASRLRAPVGQVRRRTTPELLEETLLVAKDTAS